MSVNANGTHVPRGDSIVDAADRLEWICCVAHFFARVAAMHLNRSLQRQYSFTECCGDKFVAVNGDAGLVNERDESTKFAYC